MAKKHEDHVEYSDSPPVDGGRDVSQDSPQQTQAPADPENSKPIQSDAL